MSQASYARTGVRAGRGMRRVALVRVAAAFAVLFALAGCTTRAEIRPSASLVPPIASFSPPATANPACEDAVTRALLDEVGHTDGGRTVALFLVTYPDTSVERLTYNVVLPEFQADARKEGVPAAAAKVRLHVMHRCAGML